MSKIIIRKREVEQIEIFNNKINANHWLANVKSKNTRVVDIKLSTNEKHNIILIHYKKIVEVE